jgi:hypothetical protein
MFRHYRRVHGSPHGLHEIVTAAIFGSRSMGAYR